MMAYADGLKLLAEVENPRPADMAEADYQLWLADLIESKYTYVVASQVPLELHGLRELTRDAGVFSHASTACITAD